MRARNTGAAVAIAVASMLLPAGTAVGVEAGGSSLADARDRLDGAARELSEVETAIQRTNDEVAALDERLMTATTDLARVRDELDSATARRDQAVAAERDAAAALTETDQLLRETLAEWGAHRERMQQRAVHAFKHGGTTSQELLLRGVTSAGGWHEVAVTLEIVERIAADDTELLAGDAALTRSTAALHAQVGAARTTALATAQAARDEQRRVAALVVRHEDIARDIGRERARRAEVLESLEADATARAVLVRDLRRRVTELERAAITVLVPIDVDLDVYGPPPAWAARLPSAGTPYGAALAATAARHGIDGRLLAALVWTESGFRPDAVSHAGAMGLAQLMPGTARGLGVDPRDPLQNLDGGARYLRSQLDRFGDVELALAAYNAGPGRVERAGGRVPDIVETQLYVVRVLDRYRKLTG